MPNKKILLTGASLQSNNLGINAMTLGSLKAILEQNEDIEIELLNQTADRDRVVVHNIRVGDKDFQIKENMVWGGKFFICGLFHLYFGLLPDSIKKFVFFHLLDFVYYIPAKIKKVEILKKDTLLKKLITSGYVISLAEGDSFSDIYGLKVFLKQSLDKIITLSYKKPFIVFPQTIGPFDHTLSKRVAIKILKNAQKIYVREKESQKYLNKTFGELNNIEDANDMALLMEPKETDIKELKLSAKDVVSVGINISGFLYNDTRGKQILKGRDYSSLVVEIIHLLLFIEKEVKIFLVSHVSGEDYFACSKVYRNFQGTKDKGRVVLLKDTYSAPEIKYIISRMAFFTGARMHACIAALSTSVPTVPQAYSHKFLGITEKFKLGEYVVDLRSDSVKMILDKIEKGFRERSILSEKLHEINPQLSSESYKCANI